MKFTKLRYKNFFRYAECWGYIPCHVQPAVFQNDNFFFGSFRFVFAVVIFCRFCFACSPAGQIDTGCKVQTFLRFDVRREEEHPVNLSPVTLVNQKEKIVNLNFQCVVIVEMVSFDAVPIRTKQKII